MKVVLAYSGGLDTSVMVKWLQDRGDEVVTFTGDIGQNEDLGEIKKKAEKLNAKAYVLDLREEFVKDYVFKAIKANALYEGVYPIATSLARPLIAKYLVEIAEKENADAIAHGCTGKGNDKVRFDIAIKSLNEKLKVVSPAVEWSFDRKEEMDYAKKHGIQVSKKIYSVDQNLYGRSIECGVLENPAEEPPEDVFEWTKNPVDAPDEPEYLEIEFDKGIPVKLNGKEYSGVELIAKVNEIAGKHGIGRIDHVEDRIVGLKSREIYESPAGITLISAHDDLEKYVCTIHENLFRKMVEDKWTFLVYSGLWTDPLREDLEGFIDSINRRVSGSVRVKLFKGALRIVGRSSDYGLYDRNLATYDKGSLFDQKSSNGFIELWGLQSRIYNKIIKNKKLNNQNNNKEGGKWKRLTEQGWEAVPQEEPKEETPLSEEETPPSGGGLVGIRRPPTRRPRRRPPQRGIGEPSGEQFKCIKCGNTFYLSRDDVLFLTFLPQFHSRIRPTRCGVDYKDFLQYCPDCIKKFFGNEVTLEGYRNWLENEVYPIDLKREFSRWKAIYRL